MRTRILRLACLIGMSVALGAAAQTNVKKAFDDILKNSNVEVTESHKLEKDAETGIKEAQCDIYKFTMPESKINLVNNILKAFKTDEDKAYTLSSGKADKNSPQIQLAVSGNGNTPGVLINPPGYDYYYACYLAPKSEDKTGNYRYAYGIYWKKNKDKIEGMLCVTYATTLKYRQSAASGGGLTYIAPVMTAETWFNTMVGYIQSISNEKVNSSSHPIMAAKIFKQAQLCQTQKGISEADKNAVRELLKSMMSDSGKDYDAITIQLLTSALNSIK